MQRVTISEGTVGYLEMIAIARRYSIISTDLFNGRISNKEDSAGSTHKIACDELIETRFSEHYLRG